MLPLRERVERSTAEHEPHGGDTLGVVAAGIDECVQPILFRPFREGRDSGAGEFERRSRGAAETWSIAERENVHKHSLAQFGHVVRGLCHVFAKRIGRANELVINLREPDENAKH